MRTFFLYTTQVLTRNRTKSFRLNIKRTGKSVVNKNSLFKTFVSTSYTEDDKKWLKLKRM
jgi:hypothetical protein